MSMGSLLSWTYSTDAVGNLARGTTPLVRGTAPLVRGTAPLVRGTAPLVRGTAPLARGMTPLARGTPPSPGARRPSRGERRPSRGEPQTASAALPYRRPGVLAARGTAGYACEVTRRRSRPMAGAGPPAPGRRRPVRGHPEVPQAAPPAALPGRGEGGGPLRAGGALRGDARPGQWAGNRRVVLVYRRSGCSPRGSARFPR